MIRLLKQIFSAFLRMAANTTNFPGSIYTIPPGIVPDKQGMWGLFGLMQAINTLLDIGLACVTSGSSTAVTLTVTQMLTSFCDHSGTPGAGVTVTTPTAAQIIAAWPQTFPQDGTGNYLWRYLNDSLGQTATITGGTGVTVIGTATVNTATKRDFLVNVNPGAGTVTLVNVGGGAM